MVHRTFGILHASLQMDRMQNARDAGILPQLGIVILIVAAKLGA